MSASANADTDTPVPCSTPNCGFWGRTSTGNFCSRCYKEKTKVDDTPARNKTDQEKKQEKTSEKVDEVGAKLEERRAPKVAEVEKKETVEVVEEVKVETKPEIPQAKVKCLPAEEGGKKRKQKNRMRCFECRKKVGLTGIECSCGYVFCGVHRYPEEHKCDYDFKAEARERYNLKFAGKGAVVDKIVGEKL